MRTVSRLAVLLIAFAFLSCGDSTDPGTRNTLDFESRPDNGFNNLALPDTLANGVVFTAVLPSGDFQDFTTADGWGLIGCDASAHSGTKLMGFEGADTVTGVIMFNPPVSRVDLFIGSAHNSPITMKAFNGSGTMVDSAGRTSTCPMLGSADSLSVSVSGKTITKIELRGRYPAFDDLSFYR
jgi:hypothetical protein